MHKIIILRTWVNFYTLSNIKVEFYNINKCHCGDWIQDFLNLDRSTEHKTF